VNSIATIFTLDLYLKVNKAATERHLVLVGRIAAVTATTGVILRGPRLGFLAGLFAAGNLGLFLYARIVKPDLLFVFFLDPQNALNFQLLGGVWILQTLPAIVFGLFTRWFHRWALLAGWTVGMAFGTIVAYGYCTLCNTRPFANSLSVVPLLAAQTPTYDLVIRNGRVLDGRGHACGHIDRAAHERDRREHVLRWRAHRDPGRPRVRRGERIRAQAEHARHAELDGEIES